PPAAGRRPHRQRHFRHGRPECGHSLQQLAMVWSGFRALWGTARFRNAPLVLRGVVSSPAVAPTSSSLVKKAGFGMRAVAIVLFATLLGQAQPGGKPNAPKASTEKEAEPPAAR